MKRKHLKNIILLFTLWIGLTLWSILQYDKSFFVLTGAHSFESFTQIPEGKITAGKKVAGEFVARENNLGSISIYFNVDRRIAYHLEDRLIFRIKEKGSIKWHYENYYRSGMMYDAPFFPFGFQPITDSKGKTYEFELESISGNEINAHSLRKSYPTLESKYIFDRGYLADSPDRFARFIFDKFFNKVTTLEIVFFSFVVSLPFVSYVIWITFLYRSLIVFINAHPSIQHVLQPMFEHYKNLHKMIEESYFLILGIFLFATVVVDTFFIQVRTDLIYIVVAFMWIRSFISNRLSDGISITLALALLILAAILDIFSFNNSAMKSAAWSLIFFISSLVFLIKRRKFASNRENR